MNMRFSLFRRNRRATTALEFAILAPILTTFLAAAADYGYAVWTSSCMSNAVAEAAYYAYKTGTTVTVANVTNYVQKATCLTSGGVALAITALPAPTDPTKCYCPTGSPASLGAAVSCATTCTDGTAPGNYMTISAQYTLPALPLKSLLINDILKDSVTVRLK
jgi:Flp pilus assembly protein TadG